MDDRALLAAVLSDPDDDLPRLAYADWLDEHGDDDRAEFIRGQIELARTPAADDRHAQLLARCRQLEERCRADWVAGCPPGVVVGDFERGFPRRVGPPLRAPAQRVLSREDFAAMARALELFPVHVFSARLLGAASPGVAGFPQQSVYPPRGDSPLERLARWGRLARFTALDLGTGRLTTGHGDFQPGLAALAGSAHAANLTALNLSGLLLSEEAVEAVAESPHLTRLRSLDVRYNVPLQDRPAVFVETPLADQLEEIDGIDLETASAWLRRPGCRLRGLGIALDPRNDHPDFIDAAPLLGAPGLAGLRRLTLYFDGPAAWQDRSAERGEVIRVHHLLALLGSPLLAGLEELRLCGVRLYEADMGRFPELPLARNLVSLGMARGGLYGESLPRLRPLLTGGRLRRYDLSSNYLINADAAELAGWPELSRLHELRLEGNAIYGDGLAALLESPYARPWLSVSA
jgi:uncharacterized protein (TIGR02996 family)